jgi:hypothetical protein
VGKINKDIIKEAVNRLNEETITIDEAASWLGISKRSIFTYIKDGKLNKIKWKGESKVTTESINKLLDPITKAFVVSIKQKDTYIELLTSYGFRYNEDEDTYYASWYDGGTLTTTPTDVWRESGCMLNIEKTNFWFNIEDYQKFLDIMIMDETIIMKGGYMPDWDYQEYRNN